MIGKGIQDGTKDTKTAFSKAVLCSSYLFERLPGGLLTS